MPHILLHHLGLFSKEFIFAEYNENSFTIPIQDELQDDSGAT